MNHTWRYKNLRIWWMSFERCVCCFGGEFTFTPEQTLLMLSLFRWAVYIELWRKEPNKGWEYWEESGELEEEEK